jgi:glycerophosphoryl diester phosphodiesterase
MRVIGHRGAASLAPENTYAGFDLALQLGVDAIETDVQRTKDGTLVIFHDDRVERTTNGVGVLQQMTWKEVCGLDAGSWFHPRYKGQQIPLLTDFLQKYGRKTPIDLEVKQPGIEQEVLDIVSKHDLLDRVTFTSFDFPTAAHIKELAPQAKVGFLTADVSDEMIKRLTDAKITQFCPEANKVTKALVDKWRSEGLYIRVWGVKNIPIMKHAIGAEVDGMTVDFPHVLLDELGRGEQAREVVQELTIWGLEQSEYMSRGKER